MNYVFFAKNHPPQTDLDWRDLIYFGWGLQ